MVQRTDYLSSYEQSELNLFWKQSQKTKNKNYNLWKEDFEYSPKDLRPVKLLIVKIILEEVNYETKHSSDKNYSSGNADYDMMLWDMELNPFISTCSWSIDIDPLETHG